MTPVFCSIPHAPGEGKFGDCLRACVATILDLGREHVPHFADGIKPEDDAMISFERLREYLATRKMFPLFVGYDSGAADFDEVMRMVAHFNGAVHAILLCGTPNDVNHAVVVKAGKVVHDPSWGGRHSHYAPTSLGYYGFIFFGAAV